MSRKKPALGLDPRVGTGFPTKDMRKIKESGALRACSRQVSTSAHVCRECLQLPREIVAAHGAALGPGRGGLIRMHGVARLEVARTTHPDGPLVVQKGPSRSAVRVSER